MTPRTDTDAPPTDEQIEYVERLLDEMECNGDDGLCVLDILDDLACAGLRLVEDDEDIAWHAYVQALRP